MIGDEAARDVAGDANRRIPGRQRGVTAPTIATVRPKRRTNGRTRVRVDRRTARQAPDVDGQILINDGTALPGEFVQVELTETAGYDLVGAIRDAA